MNELDRPGYKNKIHSQVEALRDLGNETYLYTISGDNILFYEFLENEISTNTSKLKHKRIIKSKNIFDEMFLIKEFVNNFKEIVNTVKPDIVYIRRIVPITPWILGLIDWLRKKNVYVAYEYPTYPWKREMIVTRKKLFYYIDSFLYEKLFSKVNQLVVFGEYDGSHPKVVETMNGVDVKKFGTHFKKRSDNHLTLIAVGHIMPQHGYDKLIKGLGEYYKNPNRKRKVFINIVGPEGNGVDLKALATSYNVEKYIKFWGFQTGVHLDEIFDESDIGVDCLALNRIETTNIVGSLKSREYLARGIPFIFAGNLDFIKKEKRNLDFVLEVDEYKEYVDIDRVIEFFDECVNSPNEIRDYAEKYLSWKKMMKPVIEKYLMDTQE